MTLTTAAPPEKPPTPTRTRPRTSTPGVFGAILWRDLFVTVRELPSFLVQVVLQPLFTLFVFGTVLSSLGFTTPDFNRILLPGVVGMSVFLTAIQNTALPLAVDFAATREIEDRLLAPISLSLVALEKVVFGAMRGMIAGLVMAPVGLLMLSGVTWPVAAVLPALLVGALAALCGGALGMLLGTLVSARHINVMFTVTMLPLMFTGAAQFPWFALHELAWFQVICACNPLTYVNEALRALLLPEVRSIPLWVDFGVLGASCVVITLLGLAGFRRRAME